MAGPSQLHRRAPTFWSLGSQLSPRRGLRPRALGFQVAFLDEHGRIFVLRRPSTTVSRLCDAASETTAGNLPPRGESTRVSPALGGVLCPRETLAIGKTGSLYFTVTSELLPQPETLPAVLLG